MIKDTRISKMIEKLYKYPEDGLYLQKICRELFYGYEFSLNEGRHNGEDFYKITPNDSKIVKLFNHASTYRFSYDFGKIIDRVLYSMAIYGNAYIFIKPEYEEQIDKQGNTSKIISSIYISEVKGILKKNKFFYKIGRNEISEFDINEGTLITFNLREIGFKKNHFTKLAKQAEKYNTTSKSPKVPTYNFSVHRDKNTKLLLRKLRGLGLNFSLDDLSDSYILYNEIQRKLFQKKLLQYILDKINKSLVSNYIHNKKFKIEATMKNINYEESWEKFQRGELTRSELSKIVWS
ncbi:hypothetical protein HMPREF9184_00889 [Streptococcus sp. oral taxon 058 str. F0407]|uniref:hypothetical protein n=1 Tax=Streptococcus sp. oral taxon 058 TaxID=712622 RepID=UPI000234B0A3|nr:hypothetical protein [Streptococcus sp. oral taxon 058]EHI77096.1 hypothetical protein HMPREF9184_00889 [Streptococcus sp. oral taxon 058 str. F0407]